MALPAMGAMVAALVCLVAAALLRRRGERARRAPARGERLPTTVIALARIPAPPMLGGVVASPDPQRALWGAGIDGDTAVPLVRRARAGGLVAGAALGAVLAVASLPLAVLVPVLALGGRWIPDRLVSVRAARRRMRIVRDLPDLLDLLVICVEAGMALDPALRMTAARLGGPLGAEVATMLDAQALGTPRRAAYRALAERIGSDDVGRLVASLLQAEELGTPLATALAGQAEALRAVRRQLARDRAARAAPRIQLVVALVMVPGALLLVLGVMVVELAAQVGGVVG